MTDYHGAAPLPVASRGSDPADPTETSPAFSDPGLVVLADFMRAVIRDEVNTAFATDFATEGAVCRKAYPHDPREDLLESNYLPALFCWRGSIDPKRFGDKGLDGTESTVQCFWVFPPADELAMTQMAPVLHGIAAALVKAIEAGNGRHPAYVVTGDTDPFAADYGSSILDHGGFWVVDFDGDFRFSEVRIGAAEPLQAIFWQLKVREHHVPGVPDDRGDAIHLTIDQPGDDPIFSQEIWEPTDGESVSGFTDGFSSGFR